MFNSINDINEILVKHVEYRSNCLNLIASENYASETVRDYLSGDFSNRYGCYNSDDISDREYAGNKYIHEFEISTIELFKDVFKAKYADLRPISGHLAGMSVVLGIMEPGDTVIEVHLRDWGHGLVGPMCNISQFDATINVKYMAFDSNGAVDKIALLEQIKEIKPKMVILGGSGTLFPEPVKDVADVCREMGVVVAYDASHVTGLIAGGTFPNPLEEGADIMFGSTHKSFPGPQGGFVASNDEKLLNKVGHAIAPSLVTSHHLNRLPALAASLLEMKNFGGAYSSQVVKNSKALAKAMDDYGFNVKGKEHGFSESHLILLNAGMQDGVTPGKFLESVNILCSDDFAGEQPEVRIGTAEATRQGMKEKDMLEIAKFFKRALLDKEDKDTLAAEIEEYAKVFAGKCVFSY